MNVTLASSNRPLRRILILLFTVCCFGSAQAQERGVLREVFETIGGSSVSNLTGSANYPDKPHSREILPNFSASSYGDNYGTRLRGFLAPTQSGTYRFWIAGDDNSILYLSDSDNLAEAVKIAEVPSWTSEGEWEKYSSQRSEWFSLEAAKRYYIEVLHKEGGGGDHVAVAWEKADAFGRTIIPGEALAPFVVENAEPFYASAGVDFSVFTPARSVLLAGSLHEVSSSGVEPNISWTQVSGPSVDLQNSNTLTPSFDALTEGVYTFQVTVTIGSATAQEQVVVTAEPPLGEGTGQFIQEFWLDLDGGDLEHLNADPDFPNRPHLIRVNDKLEGPVDWSNRYGMRTRGYLTPPETGSYTFWVMGDDEVALFLDSDNTGDNTELMAFAGSATGYERWNRYDTQKSAPVTLERGKRYYMELMFSESWGSDYHAAAWSRDGGPPEVISGEYFAPIVPESTSPLVNDNLHFAAEAGPDQEIRSPDSLAFLKGRILKIRDSYSLESVEWRQVSGPPATISYPDELQTNVTLQTEGVCVFQLSVRADGLVATDQVTIARLPKLNGATGGFTREIWLDISGSAVNDLESHPDFPGKPDIVDQVSSLAGPLNWASKYGSRLSGYLVPSRTGPHTFYISADDSAKLLLSTDSNSANAREIASSGRVSLGDYRSESQISKPIELVAGQRYYIEARHKQYWGNDHLQVAWSFGDENAPTLIGAGNLEPRLPGIAPANALLAESAPAGEERRYAAPTSTVRLQGKILDIGAEDPFAATEWTYLGDNPAIRIDKPDSLSTNVRLAGEGVYRFRLTLHSHGQIHYDDVVISISPALSPDAGGLLRSVWLNVRDSSLAELLEADPTLSDPDFQDVLPNMEAPENWSDHYGQILRGYLHIPTTGEYQFRIASDDMSELLLGTSADPASARKIASLSRAVSPRDWDRHDEQVSVPIALQAGQRYYIEARHKEGYRSDHLSVAWSGPGIEQPEIITAGYLSPLTAAMPHADEILVMAGDDQSIQWPARNVDLLGRVFDHHNGPGALRYQWTASEASVHFADPKAPATTATFAHPGAFQITLAATDGPNTAQDSLTVIVQDPLAPNAGGITREVWFDVGGHRVEHLLESDRYRQSANLVDTITSFETPPNWADDYGQRLRGYILPPVSGAYEFFASGDDQVLVSMNLAGNDLSSLEPIILTDRARSFRRWDQSESQRSGPIALSAGQAYAIEVIHKEGGWSDHLSVAWRRPGQDEIEIISGAYLVPESEATIASDNLLVAAPANIVQRWPQNTVDLRGFALDMSPGPLPLTTRWEQMSGPGKITFSAASDAETNAHASEPGIYELRLFASDGSEETFDSLTLTIEEGLGSGSGAATHEIYTDIKGNRVHNILDSEKYPGNPDIAGPIARLDQSEEIADNYGAVVSGHLLAPETGNYRFSVAGDDWVELWLSPDDDPANRRMLCFTPSYTDYYEWDKYPEYQTSKDIPLQSGQRYYLEIRHKESGWRDHFAVAWLRPSAEEMEIVEGAYLAPVDAAANPVVPPTITLNGAEEVTVFAGSSYADPGASALDADGKDITSTLLVNDFVDTNQQGVYSVRYQVVNPDTGFAETAVRTVEVVAGPSAPASFPMPTSSTPPAETWTEPAPDQITAAEASRFLAQATFGPTKSEIDRVQEIGYSPWIDEQMALPPSLHRPAMQALAPLLKEMDMRQGSDERLATWWTHAISAEDQLRQRVAFALSEIFVVSDRNTFQREGQAMANYYDILVSNAFGSYRDLLGQVTLNPMMGQYLTLLRSDQKQPDENYAREVLQLFSIGLNLLNPDGTLLRDANGKSIPTYDQDVILELSRAFTGWTFAGSTDFYWVPWGREDLINPMMPMDARHDNGAKELMGGFTLPAGLSAFEDMNRALDHIANHPNVGPFIARRLIQRLVTSNPSPGYIFRVAQSFDNGNLGAMVKAILLDPEAREPSPTDVAYGKLREPILRLTHLLRAFEADTSSNPPVFGRYPIANTNGDFHQSPLQAPSVFNFFDPFYAPPGPLQDAGLVAPEFAINTEITTVETTNFLHRAIDRGAPLHWRYSAEIRPKLEALIARSSDTTAVIDELDLLLTAGSMSNETRSQLIDTLNALDEPEDIAETALKLVISSPEFSIQK